MLSLRTWATPLTIGLFAIMGVTGLLMFFEAETGFNKLLHEWAGLVMATAVTLHVVVNWAPFKRYLGSSNLARAIIAACVLALAASFTPQPDKGSGGRPIARIYQTVLNAPLSNVAALRGETPDELIARLKAAGFEVQDSQTTIVTLTNGDREQQEKAVSALVPAP